MGHMERTGLPENFPIQKSPPGNLRIRCERWEGAPRKPESSLNRVLAFRYATYYRDMDAYEGEESLPYGLEDAERVMLKIVKLDNLHRELAGYYRSKSSDRRTISTLWYLIDGLELDLRAEGVEL